MPPEELLFLRNRDEEAELLVNAGAETTFASLVFQPRPLRPRGAMETSLRDGLFLMPYGPAYYAGYVDRMEASSGAEVTRSPAPEPRSTKRALVWTLRGGSAALLATSAIFGALAWDAHSDFEDTTYQRPAAKPAIATGSIPRWPSASRYPGWCARQRPISLACANDPAGAESSLVAVLCCPLR